MSTLARLRSSGERFDRTLTVLADAIEAVEDEMAGLRAQSFDPTGRSSITTVAWCDEHEQELADCQRDELGCTIADDIIPVHSDPTGDTALQHDPCRTEMAELNQIEAAITKQVRRLEDWTVRNRRRPARSARPDEKRKVEESNAKPCSLCVPAAAKLHQVEPKPAYIRQTTVGSRIPEPLDLCEGHYDRIRRAAPEQDPIPSVEDTTTWLRTKTWPKPRVRQMSRLNEGIKTGQLV